VVAVVEVAAAAIVCHEVVVIAVAFPAAVHHPVVLSVAGQLPDLQGAAQVEEIAEVEIDQVRDQTDRMVVIVEITSAIDKTTDRMLPEISTMIAKIGTTIVGAVSQQQS
jgi:hypothetical protein